MHIRDLMKDRQQRANIYIQTVLNNGEVVMTPDISHVLFSLCAWETSSSKVDGEVRSCVTPDNRAAYGSHTEDGNTAAVLQHAHWAATFRPAACCLNNECEWARVEWVETNSWERRKHDGRVLERLEEENKREGWAGRKVGGATVLIWRRTKCVFTQMQAVWAQVGCLWTQTWARVVRFFCCCSEQLVQRRCFCLLVSHVEQGNSERLVVVVVAVVYTSLSAAVKD